MIATGISQNLNFGGKDKKKKVILQEFRQVFKGFQTGFKGFQTGFKGFQTGFKGFRRY